jgi:uncharacterized membrane protein SirB2
LKLSKFLLLLGLGSFFLGLSIFSVQTFAQTNEHEEHDSEQLENVLNDYRKNNNEMVKRLQEMNSDGNISESEKAELIKLYKSTPGGKGASLDQKAMLKNMEPTIRTLTKHFSSMSFDQARSMMAQNISQTPAKPMLKIFPKFVDFVTHLLRSDTALLSLFNMVKDKKKLLHFLIVNVVIFIMGFFILRKKPDLSFGQRFVRWFIKKGTLISLRVGVLIYFFSNEIGPTWTIAVNTFF